MKNNEKKKKIVVSALLVGLLAGVVNFTTFREAMAWGPDRTTYTNENPAPSAVFNSITNNAAVGDERNFVRIGEVRTDGTRGTYSDEVEVSGGKEYEVYIYYHNNASSTYNTKEYNYRGVAWETKLSVEFPQGLKAGESDDVYAEINSEKTLVERIWDEAKMKATEDVKISYVTGSAKIYNRGKANGSVLPESLFTEEGTYIGHDKLNGLILGCDEYSGEVVFRLIAEKIESEPEPEEPVSAFEIDKKASKNGTDWEDDIVGGIGEEVTFKITFKNTGTVAQKDVTVFDTLEGLNGAEYVKGSTKIVKGEKTEETKDTEGEGLFDGGLKIGEVEAGETVEIYYKVKIAEREKFSCGKTTLNNLAGASGRRGDVENSGVATKYDKVQIEIEKEGGECLPAELPKTGPAQIILAIVVCSGILCGTIYWLDSRRKLKKLQMTAKGEMMAKDETSAEDVEKTPEM